MNDNSSRKPPLIATYFTLAGNILPLEGSMVSPVPFRERAEAAGRAGYQGFGFAQQDLDHLLESMRYAEIRSILDDNGLDIVELEVLLDWFLDGERRRESDLVRDAMLRSAEALGARHIKVGSDLFGASWPPELMAEEFTRLCDQAREAGTRVGIELFPTATLATIEQGMAVVSAAGRANGGLILDIWHMTRANIDFAEIAALPASAIVHIELDDGPAEQTGEILEETINRRELCGEGAFDLPGFLGSIAATGYDGTFGVEILSDTHRLRGSREAAELSYSTTRNCLERWFVPPTPKS